MAEHGVERMDFWTYTTTRDTCHKAGAADAPDSFDDGSVGDKSGPNAVVFLAQFTTSRKVLICGMRAVYASASVALSRGEMRGDPLAEPEGCFGGRAASGVP